METKHESFKNKSNEKEAIKNIALVGMIIAVFLLSVIQSFQIRIIKNQITGNSIKNGGVMDTSSWTADEKMQYEHHKILPARLKQSSNQISQVGSC